MNTSNIAVFINVEHLSNWITTRGLENLLAMLNKKGSTVVRKAYGNWSTPNITPLQNNLNQLGFELSANFHPTDTKHAAGVQFTIDVTECVLRRPETNCYVLATGDADFSPLFCKLHHLGKEVIGVGPKSSLHKSNTIYCSQYIATDSQTSAIRKTSSGYNRDAALARNTLRGLDNYVPCQKLKQRMLEIDPLFDETKHGFSTFRQFLEYIPTIHVIPILGSQEAVAYLNHKKPKQSPPPHSDHATRIVTNHQSGTASDYHSTVPQTPQEKPTPHELYRHFLASHHWYIVPKQQLIRIYHSLLNVDTMTRKDLEDVLARQLQDETNQSTIRNCITIFMKSGLFSLHLRDQPLASDDKLWKLEKNISYINEIDFSLLTRLLADISENQQVVDLKAIKAILYGKYSERQLAQLVSDASTKLMPINE
ncbi:MAG: hypothetical protein CSB47_10495 [Proteobacteria bacterium]|nr:MAG: hypothetical protein CSB47_10495 [Pseudomonadota bacterium]